MLMPPSACCADHCRPETHAQTHKGLVEFLKAEVSWHAFGPAYRNRVNWCERQDSGS